MTLSVSQMTLMSRLLEEALPLDDAARRVWLERLSPEYRELAPALSRSLLPDDAQAARVEALASFRNLAQGHRMIQRPRARS